MISKVRNFVTEFFYAPLDLNVLALFRILFSTLMLVEAFYLYPDLNRLFGSVGFLDPKVLQALGVTLIPNFPKYWSWITPDFGQLVHGIYYLYIFSIFCMLLGFQTRLVTFVTWLTQAFFMNCSYLSVYGVDRYFQVILFLAIFSPWGKALSVDTAKENTAPPSTSARFWLRMLQIAVALTYANSGIAKMLGSDWWTGTAIWRAVHLPEFHRYDLLWFGKWPVLFKVLCWGTLFCESLFPLTLFFKRFRWVLVPILVSMHIGIAVFLGLYLFATTMILLDVMLFLLPDVIDRVRKYWTTTSLA